MNNSHEDITAPSPRRCPVCHRHKPAKFDLCSDCQVVYGHERAKWPGWLSFLVRTEKCYLRAERLADAFEFVPDHHYELSVDEDGVLILVVADDDDEDMDGPPYPDYPEIDNPDLIKRIARAEDDFRSAEEIKQSAITETNPLNDAAFWSIPGIDIDLNPQQYFGDPDGR